MAPNIRKATWKCNIFKNKCKDKECNFPVKCSPTRPKELLREAKGWPTDIGCNMWWDIKCAQHAAHNPNFGKNVTIESYLVGALKRKRPVHLIEGGHHQRKKTPTPTTWNGGDKYNSYFDELHKLMPVHQKYIPQYTLPFNQLWSNMRAYNCGCGTNFGYKIEFTFFMEWSHTCMHTEPAPNCTRPSVNTVLIYKLSMYCQVWIRINGIMSFLLIPWFHSKRTIS